MLFRPQRACAGTRRTSIGTLSPILGALLIFGCASHPAAKHARDGDFGELRSAVDARPPTAQQARSLARKVLSYEIQHADNKKDRSFIKTIRGCSAETLPALRERAKTKDGAGAEAALVLLELKQLSDPEDFAQETDGAWRALAARASVDSAKARAKYYLDPDERVRQAALDAARDARSDKDIDALLEIARLDPDPVTRSRALLTLGYFESSKISSALRDLYPKLDQPLKLAVVQTWSAPPLYRHGGRRELERLISQKNGLDVVAAASILARDTDKKVSNPALARLTRFMTAGTTEERRLALVTMPVHHPQTTRLLLDEAHAEDNEVAVIAWSRLLSHTKYKKAAEDKLLELRSAHDNSSLALQAEAALAASGSIAVLELLSQRLSDENPKARKLAALGLIRLGELSQAAPLIADPDQQVRRTVACRISGAPFLRLKDE